MKICSALLAIFLVVGCATSGPGGGQSLPANAKRLTGDEINALLAGNTFTFVVYGKEKSFTGTSTWDAERGVAYGDYSVDHQASGTWRRQWWVEGDRKCSQSEDKPAHCNAIYSDGERYFDVGASGNVVSISTPVR